MARKFQIGDTVRVVPGAWACREFKVGHRGKVTGFSRNCYFPYTVERKNGFDYTFNARELKLIKKK
jgi:hypothetical protein